MQKYKILLFDLDNTLLNFTESEKTALPLVFKQFGFEMTEEVYQVYKKTNSKLWDAFENNKIQMEEISNSRFCNTMAVFGERIDGEVWDIQYRKNICEAGCLMPHVKEVIKKLAETHRLFVATNGFTETQISRLKHAGILEYFEEVYTSQEIRQQKPNIAFFDYIKNHMKDFKLEDTLMIGDSLKNDIEGASLAGFDTCYIHAVNGNLESPIARTYEIEDLEELLKIVL